MVALEVPQKKWVPSAVREREVTEPMTFAYSFNFNSTLPTLAMVPSPAPKRRSSFERS
jgi:hypothetical protein